MFISPNNPSDNNDALLDRLFEAKRALFIGAHPDHQAAANAARIAAADHRLCYYGTRKPNLWVGFGEDVLQKKLKSIRAHRTETPWYYWMLIRGPLLARLKGEGAKLGDHYAEVLRWDVPV
jgi:LmbE family N-acetylglucosaminyl deacetylase